MRRGFLLLLSMLMVFSITSCGVFDDMNIFTSTPKYSQYTLNPQTCWTIMGCAPEEVSQALTNSYWVQGNFISAKPDSDGNLVLTLSSDHVLYWKNHIKQEEQQFKENAEVCGEGFEVSDDYKCIEATSSLELFPASGYDMTCMVQLCAIMQK